MGAVCVDHLCDCIGISAADDDVEVREGIKGQECGGEQRVAGRTGCARRLRRPGKHGLVGSHARGITRCENEPCELYGFVHSQKIAPQTTGSKGARERKAGDYGLRTVN